MWNCIHILTYKDPGLLGPVPDVEHGLWPEGDLRHLVLHHLHPDHEPLAPHVSHNPIPVVGVLGVLSDVPF
jgi:hypothetical protein